MLGLPDALGLFDTWCMGIWGVDARAKLTSASRVKAGWEIGGMSAWLAGWAGSLVVLHCPGF